MDIDYIIKEVVYAIFDQKISLDDPSETIKEVKGFIEEIKQLELEGE